MSAETQDFRPRRVLVVDDNTDAVESLALLLKLSGHETYVAYNGMTALDAVRSHHPEVVLTDIGLPGMNGYELARRVRQDHRHEPILLVALTGYCDDEDRQEALKAGFNVHVAKPADLRQLERVLGLDAPPAH